jgi:hypothetical protein
MKTVPRFLGIPKPLTISMEVTETNEEAMY